MSGSVVTIQNSLSAGELSPSLFGRTDLEKYQSGNSTCRNFFVSYRGGVISRPGLAYVGTCKQQYPVPPRDLPFQFSLNQGYVLEFGQVYLRIKFQGAYVTEATKAVSSVNSSGVFTTSTNHGYSVGDWVFDQGNNGYSGLTWIVNSVPTVTTFTVTDLFGNSATKPASTTGTVARIYTVTSPYAAIDLPFLKYSQSADVMTLTCVNPNTLTEYPPYSLTRHANTNWTFTVNTFTAAIGSPTGLIATARSSDTLTTWYSYVVTSVDAETGEESVASNVASVQNNDIALFAGSNSLAWIPVVGAGSYNIYLAPASYQVGVPVSSVFGYIGSSVGPSFSDDNINPDFAVVPPTHSDPFAVGAITDVIPITGGINYDQSTIGWSVTSGTGSGFDGTPVVSQGSLIGFIIKNAGSKYTAGDTIAFTDSGGGVATGNYLVSANPINGDLIHINGVTLTFRRASTAPGYDEITLGATQALTLQSLSNFLNSSTDINFTCATYTYDTTHLFVTYKTPGTAGNAFTLGSGPTGWTPSAGTLTGGGTVGSGATATLTVGPESGTFPAVTSYFSQRRVYASSLNDPDTYWMSQPGLFTNMDSSVPVVDSDAITGTPWATQVNGIQFLQPMPGGLVVLTGKGAWQVNGGSSAAITPSNQNATPQAYNGCHNTVAPIAINYDILYVQAKGSIIRDLSYNFFVNIYTGTDLTVLSNHLFFNKQVVQWAYAEEPYKLIWVVMSDGTMLCLTYLKEQNIQSWTRHDTNGLFVSVCSVTEPPVDAVYTITQRFVKGAWRYYSERFDNRLWNTVEESFCVDSGLTTSLTFPQSVLSPSATSGSAVQFNSSVSVFNGGMVGQVIRVDGGIATITSVVNGFQVLASVTSPLTTTVFDDPLNTPVPAQPGTWSLAVPVTTVTSLNHLDGKTVAILADGSVVPNQTVVNGSVTLPEPASLITVGLPYSCQLQTLYLDHPENGSTVQNRRKNISAVGLRVEGTRGLQIGANQPDSSVNQNYATLPWTNLVELKDRTQATFAGSAVPLFTGDYYSAITSTWSVKGQVAVQQTYPLPASVLSVISYWETGDDR